MKKQFLLITAALAVSLSGPTPTANAEIAHDDSEMVSCIRTIMKLDEGRWSYMGTIARTNGTFRTYETTSVHSAAGPDMWTTKSFGGDVEGIEETAETNMVKLEGNSLIPFIDGKPRVAAGVKFQSCVGPDAEGRYQATKEYKLPNNDGTFDIAKNVSWYSEHGSYYAEDHYNGGGRIVSRRSGVNTPFEE